MRRNQLTLIRTHLSFRNVAVELLESRQVLSLLSAPGTDDGAAAVRGNAMASGSPIRLDLVALHEFGHSLGLDHTASGSIIDPFYNPKYALANFANDPVLTTFRALYADVNASPWKDSLDSGPSDVSGRVDVTYSFMPDRVKMDRGATNTLFATFNKRLSEKVIGAKSQCCSRCAQMTRDT